VIQDRPACRISRFSELAALPQPNNGSDRELIDYLATRGILILSSRALKTISEHLCISALASFGRFGANPWESLRIYGIEPTGGRTK